MTDKLKREWWLVIYKDKNRMIDVCYSPEEAYSTIADCDSATPGEDEVVHVVEQ